MNIENIKSKFTALGGRLKLDIWSRPRTYTQARERDYAMDIRRDRHGEFFELRVPAGLESSIELTVLQAVPRDRHLLLLVRKLNEAKQLDRFLCGHDERSWFVAAVPGKASSVAQAKEVLKPGLVHDAQARTAVKRAKRNRRNNAAFRRQGEWFFIPQPRLAFDQREVLHNEPIRRGRGKSHWLEYAHRRGGTRVYVCTEHPDGIPEDAYRDLLRSNPKAARWSWRIMQRDPEVYARGKVRHPDHATITLPGWHRVVMNTETQSRTMQNMAFLD